MFLYFCNVYITTFLALKFLRVLAYIQQSKWTHSRLMFHFPIPWKCQKSKYILEMFSGSIEMEHWAKMRYDDQIHYQDQSQIH